MRLIDADELMEHAWRDKLDSRELIAGMIAKAPTIKEMPSVKQEPCKDAISRQAVLDIVRFEDKWLFDAGSNNHDTNMAFDSIACKVSDLPPVQPKIKTGHWECIELFYDGESRGAIIKCSNCKNEYKVSPKVFENLYSNERFCNHCGAKMVEPKTGHWILLDECSNSGYYCSECHKKVVKEGWSDTVKKIKYCPNCGTKMAESEA